MDKNQDPRLDEYATGDEGLDAFMANINSIVEAATGGLCVYDLPDIDFMGSYEDGATASETALECLEYAGWNAETRESIG